MGEVSNAATAARTRGAGGQGHLGQRSQGCREYVDETRHESNQMSSWGVMPMWASLAIASPLEAAHPWAGGGHLKTASSGEAKTAEVQRHDEGGRAGQPITNFGFLPEAGMLVGEECPWAGHLVVWRDRGQDLRTCGAHSLESVGVAITVRPLWFQGTVNEVGAHNGRHSTKRGNDRDAKVRQGTRHVWDGPNDEHNTGVLGGTGKRWGRGRDERRRGR